MVESLREARAAETTLLERARREGRLSVALYADGAFSEEAWLDYGVLERLVIDRRLRYLGRSGDQRNAAFHYGLPETGAQGRAAA